MKDKSKLDFEIPRDLPYYIQKKQAVLFVGAGLSKAAGLPLWGEFIEILLKDFDTKPQTADFLDIVEYYENEFGRPRLMEKFHDIFGARGIKLTEAHKIIARLPWKTIVTGNYDRLLEKALEESGVDFKTILTNKSISLAAGDKINLLKMHGDVDLPESIVISRTDYDEYRNKNSSLINHLRSLITTNPFFFVGFSLTDPNFRLIMNEVYQDLKEYQRMNFALCAGIDKYQRKQWEKRNIKAVDILNWSNLTPFFKRLEEKIKIDPISIPRSSFDSIAKRWRKKVHDGEKQLDPRGIFQLVHSTGIINLEDIYVEPFLSPGGKAMPISIRSIAEFNAKDALRLMSEDDDTDIKSISSGIYRSQITREGKKHIFLHESERKKFEELHGKKIGDLHALESLLRFEKDLGFIEFAKHCPRAVIIGDPGSGKSVLLQYMAYISSGENKIFRDKYLPLRIPLKKYSAHLMKSPQHVPLKDFIVEYVRKNIENEDYMEAFLWKKVDEGKVLLLFDGVDEVSTLKMREKVCAEIQRVIDDHHRCPCFITSRPAGYQGMGYFNLIPHFNLKLFKNEEIEKYLQKWFELSGPWYNENEKIALNHAVTLFKDIKKNESVLKLARTPLLLFIIAQIHRQTIKLPERRVEFYDAAVKTIGRSWLELKGFQEGVDFPPLSILLDGLDLVAFNLHKDYEENIAPEDTVRDWIADSFCTRRGYSREKGLEEAEDFLEAVREKVGILVEKETGKYGFIHLTFQEYFAARHLSVGKGTSFATDFVRKCRHNPRWKEVIMLMVGMANPALADRLLRAIMEPPSLYEDFLHRDLFLASECLKDQPDGLSIERKQEITNKLIEVIQGDNVAIARGEAFNLLPFGAPIESWKKEDRNWMMKRLVNEDSDVRQSAVEYFTQAAPDDPEIRNEMKKRLGDENWRIRNSAVEYFTQTAPDDPEIRNEMKKRLGDENWRIRNSAVEYFTQTAPDDPEIRNEMKKRLGDENWRIRNSAVEYFTQTASGDPEIRNEIMKRLADECEAVRYSAVQYFTQTAPDDPEIRNEIMKRLGDENWSVSNSAFEYFTQTAPDDPEIRKEMMKRLGDEDSSVRYFAVQYFTQISPEDTEIRKVIRNKIMERLGDKDLIVRNSAVEYFTQTAPDDPEIRKIISNKILERMEIMKRMGGKDLIIGAPAVQYLFQTGPDDPEIRKVISNKIMERKEIMKSLGDEDSNIRNSAVKYFTQTAPDDPEIRKEMMKRLGDEDEDVRLSAVQYFAKTAPDDPEIRNKMMKRLEDNNSDVRLSAFVYFTKAISKDKKFAKQILDFIQRKPEILILTPALIPDVARSIKNHKFISDEYKKRRPHFPANDKESLDHIYYNLLLETLKLVEAD
ncbi:MAG: HEAT repeat domain-containing protein [Candidatus Eremiobacteraeota bacterium]|nr:HEAT repeat domain-containing protein [Candidatus Eremiobacteraeota bacterium]